MDQQMADAPYRVKLEDIFEGPMDLLVHLVKKNELEVTDIPIALITDQYLGYLDFLQSINIDVAAEFLVMAATLIQLKSRMLLPRHDEEEDDDEISRQLTRPLQEYLKMKSAAEQLAGRHLLGEDTFTRPAAVDDIQPEEDDIEIIEVGLFELIDAFKRILENMSAEHRVDMTADHMSIKDRISEIVNLLEEKGSATFGELFAEDSTRAQVIVTFLALLEMVKLRLTRIVQHVQSGVIRLFYQ
jgi:segregation and condensation protein A